MRSFNRLLALVFVVFATSALAQTSVPSTSRPTTSPTTAGPTTRPVDAPAESITIAEQIIRLRKIIDTEKQQFVEIEQKLADPLSEYSAAEKEFSAIDTQLTELKKRKQQFLDANQAQEAQAVEQEIQALTVKWDTARNRFALSVEERKTLQEKLQSLQKKIDQDVKTMASLETGPDAPPAEVKPATPEQNNPPRATTSQAAVPQTTPPPPASQPAATAVAAPVKPKDQALIKAVEEVKEKKNEAQEAANRLQNIEDTQATVVQNLETERKLLDIAKKKQLQAREEQKQLQADLEIAVKEQPDQVDAIWNKIFEARQREFQADQDVKNSEERIAGLELEHSRVEAKKNLTAQEVSIIESEVEKAEKKVKQLQNPFTPHNLAQWLIDHGPKLLMIIFGVSVLYVLVRFVSRRIANLVAINTARGSLDDRQNRAATLVGIFRQSASVVVLGGGTVMFLEEAGIPVVPLLGGAAVLGLAVAFGAQNLIRDYFAGFMVLVEDQYSVGDVVKIGETAGLVEKITLRMTMLRDLEGVAHFIPHGSISTVSNMTHSWSRALFDIPVAYKDNVDNVISVLMELAKEIRNDPEYSELILCPPEMLGVDAFADSAVIIKFVIKTRPLKQWAVKRELLRRIKNRFDQLGIEIPFPHLTVFHRQSNPDVPHTPPDLH